jgi:hypothetical protein
MSGAIANALPTCICRTLGRVGFALGRKLLRKFTNLLFRLGRRFRQPARDWARIARLIRLTSGPLRRSYPVVGLGETILFPL